MSDEHVQKPVDRRSALFQTARAPFLATALDYWPLSKDTPKDVLAKLEKARRQFTFADVDYDMFAQCVATSLQAAELLMRHLLDVPPGVQRTFGQLVGQANDQGRLTPQQAEWLKYAVLIRNRFAHGNEFALTPGMADEMMQALHLWVVDMLETNPTLGESAPTTDRDRRDGARHFGPASSEQSHLSSRA